MTDHPASHAEPSMEDILASIRRIMDDDESKASVSTDTSAPLEIHTPAEAPQTSSGKPFYDDDINSADETIFPERGGLLWRQVAGRTLAEEGEPTAEETLELTDIADASDADEYELNELLDEAADSQETSGGFDASPQTSDLAASFAGAERLARENAETVSQPASIPMPPPLPLSGTTASFSEMDRIAERMTSNNDDDDDEVIDLTRRIGEGESINDIADAMAGPMDQTPADPAFETVGLTSAVASHSDFAETTEPDSEFELEESYESALRPNSGYDAPAPDDEAERALDARFYEDGYDDVPDVEGDYASTFDPDAQPSENQVAEASDELDTVGGMVRDALRSRNPAIVGDSKTAIISGDTEESSSRALAALARYDGYSPRRAYGQLKITDDDDAPTVDAVVRDELRPMLREWLNENLPTVVENLVKQEVERISARSRRFIRGDDD